MVVLLSLALTFSQQVHATTLSPAHNPSNELAELSYCIHTVQGMVTRSSGAFHSLFRWLDPELERLEDEITRLHDSAKVLLLPGFNILKLQSSRDLIHSYMDSCESLNFKYQARYSKVLVMSGIGISAIGLLGVNQLLKMRKRQLRRRRVLPKIWRRASRGAVSWWLALCKNSMRPVPRDPQSLGIFASQRELTAPELRCVALVYVSLGNLPCAIEAARLAIAADGTDTVSEALLRSLLQYEQIGSDMRQESLQSADKKDGAVHPIKREYRPLAFQRQTLTTS